MKTMRASLGSDDTVIIRVGEEPGPFREIPISAAVVLRNDLTQAVGPITTSRLTAALNALILSPATRGWLVANDPKALEQAERALGLRDAEPEPQEFTRVISFVDGLKSNHTDFAIDDYSLDALSDALDRIQKDLREHDDTEARVYLQHHPHPPSARCLCRNFPGPSFIVTQAEIKETGK